MKEMDEKVYRLLTYGTKEVLLYFRRGYAALILFLVWSVFIGNTKSIIVASVMLALLIILVVYIDRNKIITTPPAPRKKLKEREPEQVIDAAESEVPVRPDGFEMNVDESMFTNFTFNDYAADTYKKQDPNAILDIMADRNKYVMEDLKK